MSSMQAFVSMAEQTGVFRTQELEILRELLDECLNKPDSGYRKLVHSIEGEPAGFAIYGRTPCTIAGWDLYWLVVDPRFQGKGVGRLLVDLMEKELTKGGSKAVVRVETSGRQDYHAARAFYAGTGYEQAGVIPDFYASSDDLVIFYKRIK